MTRLLIGLLVAAASAPLNAAEAYTSLEDFCLKTGADTPENCRCGQETADAIMSAEEQATALAMMAYQQQPSLSPEAQMALMSKLSEVTEGCGTESPGT